jgi:hypothetical protein
MKKITALALATLLVCGLSVRGADEISGLKGTIHRVDKNKENLDKEVKIDAKVGEVIAVQWTYPIVPGAFPTAVEGKSDSDAVKYLEARSVIVYPKLLGVGRVAGTFRAEKAGTATIAFTVKSKDGDTVVKATVEVK